MDYLKEYWLNCRIYPGAPWWPQRVVDWYCQERGINQPKSRCHFGEIVLFYSWAYLVLGILFKALFCFFWLIWAILYPVRRPIISLYRFLGRRGIWDRLYVLEQEDRSLFWSFQEGALLILALLLLYRLLYKESPEVPVYLFFFLMAEAMAMFYSLQPYLISVARRLKPVWVFGREAGQRIKIGLPKRKKGLAPAEKLSFKERQTIKTIGVLFKTTWKQKVCPRLSISPKN